MALLLDINDLAIDWTMAPPPTMKRIAVAEVCKNSLRFIGFCSIEFRDLFFVI